jgi:hypothetical protein
MDAAQQPNQDPRTGEVSLATRTYHDAPTLEAVSGVAGRSGTPVGDGLVWSCHRRFNHGLFCRKQEGRQFLDHLRIRNGGFDRVDLDADEIG